MHKFNGHFTEIKQTEKEKIENLFAKSNNKIASNIT